MSSADIDDAKRSKLSMLEGLYHEITFEKSVGPCSSGLGLGCFEDSDTYSSHENVGKKSIDPPPYSPLRPVSNFNARVYEKQYINSFPSNDECMKSLEPHVPPHETITEKSINLPVSSPLITRPQQSILDDPPSSSLCPISPEATNLFNILTLDR